MYKQQKPENSIILLPVGKITKNVPITIVKKSINHGCTYSSQNSQLKKIHFQPERQFNRYEGEIVPMNGHSKDSQENQGLILYTNSNQNLNSDIKNPNPTPVYGSKTQGSKFFRINSSKESAGPPKFNLIEDPRQSQFSYRKYLLTQKILLIFSIFSFFISVISIQMDILQSKFQLSQDWHISEHINLISSLVTLLLIFMMLMRYIAINELEIDQKKYYCIRTAKSILHEIFRFFSRRQSVLRFMIQVFILLPHPISLFHETHITLFQSYSKLYLKHRLNDILVIISLSRSYIVVRSMINLTMYSTPRASRLCSHNKVDHSLLYSVKCLLREEPLRIIGAVFIIQVCALGFGLKVSEGSLIYNNPGMNETGFQNYFNCYWCIFITMATVGYGDYYPKTIPGRFVALFAAVSGIILSSLLIVSLSAYLTMQTNESKSHLTLNRLSHQQNLKKEATQALIQTMKMTKYLSSSNSPASQTNSQKQSQSDQKIRSIFTSLKQKIDLIKFRSRKIKSMVNNNNIIQQMNRLFELFKDSLQELYHNQVILKDSLSCVKEDNGKERKMKTIFLMHNMEEFIGNPKAK